MPIFLDAHTGADLPPDVIRGFLQLQLQLPAARSEPTGGAVRPLDLYCGHAGRLFCILAAPDAASVRQHHAAEGIVCQRVRRVELNPQADQDPPDDLTAEERAVVQQMLGAGGDWLLGSDSLGPADTTWPGQPAQPRPARLRRAVAAAGRPNPRRTEKY